MKKTLLLLTLCAAIAACGGGGSDTAGNDADSAQSSNQVAESRNPEVDTATTNIGTNPTPTGGDLKGKDLIAQSDCLSCHRENEKLVGPAYVDVANKYENNDKDIDYLAQKIIEGGQGVWGQVPMTPHPALSKDDAKDMAKYILSLKK